MPIGNYWRGLVIVAVIAGWALLAVPAPAAAHTYSKDEIIAIMTAAPHQTCFIGEPDTWRTFARTQHDDTTVALLLELYSQPPLSRIQAWALECLSNQRRDELLALWVELLHQRNNGHSWSCALRGLETINSPAANAVVLELLTDSATPVSLLSQACGVAARLMPSDVREAIEPLRYHPSAAVRCAAFRVLWEGDDDRVIDLRSSLGYRNSLLRAALADSDATVQRWALLQIHDEASRPLLPLMFACLANPDTAVRIAADGALCHFLQQSTAGDNSDFAVLRQALREGRWDYARAPQLALRYGGRLERQGQLAGAACAYEIADHGFPADADYLGGGNYSGATALYRLMQVKRKMGDVPAARVVLRRMVAKYPASSRVYAEDNPLTTRGGGATLAVSELAEQLEQYFDSLPLAGSVTLAQTVSADTFVKLIVAIRNITNSLLILKCARQEHPPSTTIVPLGRPTVLIDACHGMDFRETVFLADTGETVTLAPGASFGFAATIPVLLEPGPHGIDFVLEATCILPSGETWSGYVVANSLTVIDKFVGDATREVFSETTDGRIAMRAILRDSNAYNDGAYRDRLMAELREALTSFRLRRNVDNLQTLAAYTMAVHESLAIDMASKLNMSQLSDEIVLHWNSSMRKDIDVPVYVGPSSIRYPAKEAIAGFGNAAIPGLIAVLRENPTDTANRKYVVEAIHLNRLESPELREAVKIEVRREQAINLRNTIQGILNSR